MRIGEMAVAAGVSTSTLRFYERRGLIQSVRSSNGYRHYEDGTELILHYIATAKSLGYSLGEIGRELRQFDQTRRNGEGLRDMLRQKVREVDEQIRRLEALRSDLNRRIGLDCPFGAA